MKHRGGHPGRWGEGWLLAAALGLLLALSLGVFLSACVKMETVEPLHSVPVEILRRMEMVNLNTATAEELEALPGVGEVLAERIVAHREAHGAFLSVEDLLDVEGLGEGKLEGLRGLVYIELSLLK